MKNITNIYDVSRILFDVLGDEYHKEITNGACLNDTIRLTRDGSTNAMYIGLDVDCPTVIDAAVYEEPDGYHERDEWPIAEGIYWDTKDASTTPESIAADIEKYF